MHSLPAISGNSIKNKYHILAAKQKESQTCINRLRKQIQYVEITKQKNLLELEQFVSLLDVSNETRLELSNKMAKVEQSISYVDKQNLQIEKRSCLIKATRRTKSGK